MYYQGLIIGAATFLIIGLFHPIVIKSEYYFGVKIWPIFLLFGLVLCGVSLFVGELVVSAVLSIIGITSLWSILELFQQKKRVEKGWFPKNPNRES